MSLEPDPPPKILVVDDDSLLVHLVEAMLRPLDAVVIHAASGERGLELMREQDHDLVLLDFDLPDINGLRVLAASQADAELRDTPVIFITGSDNQGLLSACFSMGAADYVSKPFCAPELVARVSSVLERQRMTQRLHDLAYKDQLTGLPNRRAIWGEIQEALACTQAHRALLFLDFDRFKLVNDSLGHDYGDLLLQQIADRLRASLRPDGARGGIRTLAGRLGGDEFVVFVDGLKAREDVDALSKRLLAELGEPYVLQGHKVSSTASIGVVYDEGSCSSADELLRDADAAMYVAKRRGRGRHVFFDPSMRQAAAARMQLETELREAHRAGQFVLHFQPVIHLDTGRTVAVEALLRWAHPTRGLLAPADFLVVMEDMGLIIDVGEWVLHAACAALTDLKAELGSDAPPAVQVNLSRKQLLLPSLVGQVEACLSQHDLPPSALHLEVDEDEMMQDPATAAQIMGQLRGLGVGLAMDDFGIGRSSLSCLRDFPLDTLKLDGSLLRGLGMAEYDALLRAVGGLARTLQLHVVAEGVENAEVLPRLRAVGCDLAQGFLFARPMPLDALIRHLRDPEAASLVAP